jgi:hypothetical protein
MKLGNLCTARSTLMIRGLVGSKRGCKGAVNSSNDERLSFWGPWKSVVELPVEFA